MSTPKRLPTVYHGVPDSSEDTRIVEDALQDIVARLNSVPGRLGLSLICSVLVTVCCAQDDPKVAFQTIGMNVAKAVDDALAKPEGSA